jgi:hypothetical protein
MSIRGLSEKGEACFFGKPLTRTECGLSSLSGKATSFPRATFSKKATFLSGPTGRYAFVV